MRNNFIDPQAMMNLIVRNHDTVIGKFNGNETTVEQEIGAACHLIARAESDDIDYFRSHGQVAFRQVEAESAKERKNRYYHSAAKKILFLSSKSKELIGSHIVVKKVDKNDQEEMMDLAEEFSDTLQYLADEARARH